jgi:glycosyltransferase involved in cell wall biosynthesis
MERPEVSVLMAVYNGRPYLETSVRSILNQTFEDFEFIIINDGSEDGSEKTLEQFAAKDERVRLVHQENKGLITSLNRGLGMARGKYIARMDADDISDSERFEEQVHFLDSNPGVGIVGTQVEVINKRGEEIDHWAPPTESCLLTWRLLFNAPYVHPSVMARRNLLENLNGYSMSALHSEDYELWTRVAQVSRLSTVPQTLLKFRLLESSVTGANRQEQMRTNCRVATDFHRVLLGGATDEDIARFLVWLYQFGLERAVEETGVDDFGAVYEYLGRLYRAHRERFGSQGPNIQVRREVLPRLDLMAAKIAEEEGMGVGLWYKIRARLMRPTYEVFPWLWRSAREKLMPAT